MKNIHLQYLWLSIEIFNRWNLNCDLKIIWDRGRHICNSCSRSRHHSFSFYSYNVCHLFDYSVIGVVLVFDLVKTSFQEERSWHEAENRPAHILFGSLHRKWKYVSKAKKQNFTFITFVHTKAFHAKGAHKKVYQDKAKNCIITPHHISTKCVNMLLLNISQF